MKNDETTDPRNENEFADNRRNEAIRRDKEDKARQQGINKGAITTSIIGLLLFVTPGILVYSNYNR